MATAFWIASKNQFVQEAARSADSLRRHTDARCILFTPDDVATVGAFDEVRRLPTRRSEFWFVDVVRYFGLAVEGIRDERQLYLDTDTYVCGDVSDLFKILDKYDFCGAHAPWRRTAPHADGVPRAFPEINVGVNAIKRSQAILWLMDDWMERMERNPQNNDQPALRASLWEASNLVRLYVLPPEYNCRWQFGGFARYPIKVLHGRCDDYEAVARRLNAGKDLRGWKRGELP